MKVSKIDGRGNHLLLEGYDGDFSSLANKDLIKEILSDLPNKLGLTKISKPDVVRYNGEDKLEDGVSGMVLMAESHISIHTYPLKGFVVADVFSCKEFDVDKITNFLKEKFGFNKINKKLILREYERN
tara:strand:- start:406 stop:789 length:384 start_codon:yes stop_codon:yes gene_type:complete